MPQKPEVSKHCFSYLFMYVLAFAYLWVDFRHDYRSIIGNSILYWQAGSEWGLEPGSRVQVEDRLWSVIHVCGWRQADTYKLKSISIIVVTNMEESLPATIVVWVEWFTVIRGKWVPRSLMNSNVMVYVWDRWVIILMSLSYKKDYNILIFQCNIWIYFY